MGGVRVGWWSHTCKASRASRYTTQSSSRGSINQATCAVHTPKVISYSLALTQNTKVPSSSYLLYVDLKGLLLADEALALAAAALVAGGRPRAGAVTGRATRLDLLHHPGTQWADVDLNAGTSAGLGGGQVWRRVSVGNKGRGTRLTAIDPNRCHGGKAWKGENVPPYTGATMFLHMQGDKSPPILIESPPHSPTPYFPHHPHLPCTHTSSLT